MKTIKDFMNEDFDYVSYRLTSRNWHDKFLKNRKTVLANSIFAGCFSIQNGAINSLDGDTYSENEKVVWSETWSDEKEGIKKGLTILVLLE